jgi:ribosomal-protein-alanine N-acetyltransferase
VNFRDAHAGESAELAALHEQVFETSVWDAAFWRNEAGDPNQIVLVADPGEARPVGVLALRMIAPEAEVLTLAVHPDWRRRGCARGLLTTALPRLAAAGIGRLFLEVAEQNTAAAALYGGLGFRATGRRKGYYGMGKDAVLMERSVSVA